MSSPESLGGSGGEGVPFLCPAQKGNQRCGLLQTEGYGDGVFDTYHLSFLFTRFPLRHVGNDSHGFFV